MKILSLLVTVILTITLCGCNGYREINRGYLVTSMGFGNSEDNVTIYIEALSSSDVSDKKSERVVLTGSGKDINSAYKKLKSTLVKPLYFDQLGAVIFEGKTDKSLEFLKSLSDINYGIYVIKTDDIKTLFSSETPGGVLGYDIITLIKTQSKPFQKHNQLYNIKNEKLLTVNFCEGNFILK